ncbi:hypothetical protein [Rubrimonas cliftonensis]|uniref:Uncharacterized protein n=1 Tax=Rubrimonas cliftonensis TaxID=89524 RepID=A0A1H3XA07_9RHOB|nr:hypothetical protein [Rubrimonas cliftonensis]SDZ96189.1 hypothetical protein SAMN05444370_102337 [Rubrimonas cliftonensis]
MATRQFSEDDLLAYVRGAARPDLSDRIEAAMAAEPALKAEIALMRGLGPALRGEDAGPDATAFGWRRLEAAIRREPSGRADAAAPRRMAMWRAAAALLAVVGLGQAVYIAAQWTGGEAPAYRTASEPAARHVLGVGFAPDATAAAIAELLTSVEARIVDGPGAIGLYRLGFASAEARDAARARLEASPLIDLVADE